jgi:hypothetical protein
MGPLSFPDVQARTCEMAVRGLRTAARLDAMLAK